MRLDALAEKTRDATGGVLLEHENPFSTNKVTGYSLNFPIIGTCSPTKVCAHTCYFARGPSTWPASLAKQKRLLASVESSPQKLASQIVQWIYALNLSFVRWSGGGDLTPAAVECLDAVAVAVPTIPQWVVTRKPSVAATVVPRKNVYLHFSVDRSSWERLTEFAFLAPRSLNWHWSYQCDADEVPPERIAPVVFRNHYKPKPGESPREGDCPLNWVEDISGTCGRCRRCFDGSAVEAAKSMMKEHQHGGIFPVPIWGDS